MERRSAPDVARRAYARSRLPDDGATTRDQGAAVLSLQHTEPMKE